MILRLVDSSTLGRCPAAVVMGEPPVYEINADRWPLLTDAERRFILAHEMGHHALHTSNEAAADRYALLLTAGTRPRSLKSAMSALYSMESIPYERLEQLFKECITLDKKNIETMKQKLFTQNDYIYADGGAEIENSNTAAAQVQLDNASSVLNRLLDRKRAGVRINGCFFPMESIFGFCTLVCVLIITCKICKR